MWLFVFISLATAGGVVYAVLRDDVSGGLTIGTYLTGFLTLITAVWGAGEHFGVQQPDSYSYAFDTVYGYEVHEGAQSVHD